MPERAPSPEQRDLLPSLREQMLAHFERQGHRITAAELDLLIGSIETQDLSNDPLVAVVGRTPLAKVRRGEVTLDHQFELLNQEQQLHVLLHEYSHALTWFWREQENTERYDAIRQRIAALPNQQVSYYINYLETALEDTPGKPSFIEEERLAEVVAQYLESDRTFSGFIQAKLLEFPQGDKDLTEVERQAFAEIVAQVGELGEYLDIAESETEREEFLARHSDLLPHYELWRELGALLEETDFAELEEFGSLDEFDDEFDVWEDLALIEHIHPEVVLPDRQPRTALQPQQQPASPPSFLSEIINFWRIFPNEST